MPLTSEATDSLIADLITSKDVEEAKAKLAKSGYDLAPSGEASTPEEGADKAPEGEGAKPDDASAEPKFLGIGAIRSSMAKDYNDRMAPVSE